MSGPIGILFTIWLLTSSGAPAKHAWISCAELLAYGTDDGEGIAGPFPADSSGKIIVTSSFPGVYHCSAKAENSSLWTGEFLVARDKQVVEIELPPK